MKQHTKKLALRSETIRRLDRMQLRNARGGAQIGDTGAATCPGGTGVQDTGDATCPGTHAVATLIC